ncbi:MAG: hypothetical protein EP330_18505 [Deltaproteobacteria bacterium]|nr:MAG: hypothetical protein EP330_18505 [Deltaproteobacteria bacterium]
MSHALSAETRALPAVHDLLWRWAPKHPLPMRAVFDRCWLLTFRVEPDALAARLPPGLEPWIFDDSAWLSIVVARMSDMRPTFLPRWLGVDFDQVVYRAVVTRDGERGVAFLRTEANHRLYAWGGDLLTHFHFHHAPITFTEEAHRMRLSVDQPHPARLHAVFDHEADQTALLAMSPFESVDQLRTELCDLFHAFSTSPGTGRPGRVTVQRSAWNIRLVAPSEVRAPWMTEVLFPGACAVSHAVYVEDVPYRWTAMRWG